MDRIDVASEVVTVYQFVYTMAMVNMMHAQSFSAMMCSVLNGFGQRGCRFAASSSVSLRLMAPSSSVQDLASRRLARQLRMERLYQTVGGDEPLPTILRAVSGTKMAKTER